MSPPTLNADYSPLPILRGEENLDDWRLKVIQAFAVNGMADYLFNTSTTTPEKMALGMRILIPSLANQRVYLTKAGWDFNAKHQQDPRELYNLVLKSIPQREISVQVHNILYKLLRIEYQRPVEKYIAQIKTMRDQLRDLGYIIDEHLLMNVTLHGIGPTWAFVTRMVRDELAPGSLTFDKLVDLMLANAPSSHKASNMKDTAKAAEPVKKSEAVPAKTTNMTPSNHGGAGTSKSSFQARPINALTSQANHSKGREASPHIQPRQTQGQSTQGNTVPKLPSTGTKPGASQAHPSTIKPNVPAKTNTNQARSSQAMPIPAKTNMNQARPSQAKPVQARMPGAFMDDEESEAENTTDNESEIERFRREIAMLETEEQTRQFLARHKINWRR